MRVCTQCISANSYSTTASTKYRTCHTCKSAKTACCVLFCYLNGESHIEHAETIFQNVINAGGAAQRLRVQRESYLFSFSLCCMFRLSSRVGVWGADTDRQMGACGMNNYHSTYCPPPKKENNIGNEIPLMLLHPTVIVIYVKAPANICSGFWGGLISILMPSVCKNNALIVVGALV